MEFEVLPDETLEDLQLKGLYILQKKDSFRFGMDAVLLSSFTAAFIAARKQIKIVDLGTGTGIIPVLLSAKTDAENIIGLEIQSSLAQMAQRSVDGNKLNHKISIINGDIKKSTTILSAAAYDIVVSNPPYTKVGSGLINIHDSKAIARHEICCTLMDVLKSSAYLLKPKGEFFMVHRPERLSDIIDGMRKVKIEPKILRMVCPKAKTAPSLILIKGLKNGNSGLKILPELVIYEENGDYTQEARMHYSMEKEEVEM